LVPHLDKRDVAQSEDVWMATNLQGRFDDDQAAAISFDYKRINQWIGPYARHPHHAGGLYFQTFILVFERNVILSHLYDASLGMNFDAFILQGVFHELPNLFSHSGHDSICHFNNHYAGLAAQKLVASLRRATAPPSLSTTRRRWRRRPRRQK